MMAKLKRLLKLLMPPVFISAYHRLHAKGIRYAGHYLSWDDAQANSSGYDADLILATVSDAVSKVQAGEAVYERDSVLFSKIEYSFPLLAALLRAGVENDGELNVLDFGGSLGSSYFQCREFLGGLKQLDWNVVEQAKFVQEGKKRFESAQLHFWDAIDDAAAKRSPDVFLFASVLQYLKNKDDILRQAVASKARYIIVDRTPMSTREADWLCVQHVPADIYKASYPCTIIGEPGLIALLEPEYVLVGDFDSIGGHDRVHAGWLGLPFQYKGMIWRRRER